MSWAINQRELNKLVRLEVLLMQFPEPFWNPNQECRKTKVQSDPPLLGLWILVEASRRCNCTQSFAQTGLSRINMSQYSDIYIDNLAWLDLSIRIVQPLNRLEALNVIKCIVYFLLTLH